MVVPGRELLLIDGRKCGELRWRWEVVVKWKMTKKRGEKMALFKQHNNFGKPHLFVVYLADSVKDEAKGNDIQQ